MNPILQLIIAEAPSLIDAIKSAHAHANPTAPALTSEEVLAAFEQAFSDSHAKDLMLEAALQAEIAARDRPVGPEGLL